MFLASTAKQLLNATLLVCVFMFGMQSGAYAWDGGTCTSITAHIKAFQNYCRYDTETNSYMLTGANCLFTQNWAEMCPQYNGEKTTSLVLAGKYCPPGSSMGAAPSYTCTCNSGKNWQTKHQACK